jgi:tryptophan-rich sensory protein
MVKFENRLFIYFLIVLVVSTGGALFTRKGVQSDKYITAVKPNNFPPKQLFGIVWTILYILYIYAWYEVRKIKVVQPLFLANITLNFFWCWAFFGRLDWVLALGIIYILDIILLLQILMIWNKNRKAAIALLPYLGWILFASYLNKEMVRLNQ